MQQVAHRLLRAELEYESKSPKNQTPGVFYAIRLNTIKPPRVQDIDQCSFQVDEKEFYPLGTFNLGFAKRNLQI